MLRETAVFLLFAPLAAGVTADAADQPPAAFNLITHSEVWVERPASAIWPYILDTSEWKKEATADAFSGEPGSVGEVQLVKGGSGADAYQFYVETVALAPNEHKVIKIYPDDRSHFGFAAWRLFEIDGRTLVTYDVYSEFLLPGASPEQARAAGRQSYDLNKPRFDRELRLLEKIVEERH